MAHSTVLSSHLASWRNGYLDTPADTWGHLGEGKLCQPGFPSALVSRSSGFWSSTRSVAKAAEIRDEATRRLAYALQLYLINMSAFSYLLFYYFTILLFFSYLLLLSYSSIKFTTFSPFSLHFSLFLSFHHFLLHIFFNLSNHLYLSFLV